MVSSTKGLQRNRFIKRTIIMNRLSKIGSQIIGSVAIGSQILAKLARVAASSSVRLCDTQMHVLRIVQIMHRACVLDLCACIVGSTHSLPSKIDPQNAKIRAQRAPWQPCHTNWVLFDTQKQQLQQRWHLNWSQKASGSDACWKTHCWDWKWGWPVMAQLAVFLSDEEKSWQGLSSFWCWECQLINLQDIWTIGKVWWREG